MRRKRLVSVVLLQILLVVFMLVGLAILLAVAASLVEYGVNSASLSGYIETIALGASLALYCAYVFWLLQKRKPAGRILGAFSILAFLAFSAWNKFNPPTPGPMPYIKRFEYNDPASGYTSEAVLSFLFDLLLAWWAYRFAFSKKYKEYFAVE
jgi:hypothetical protein